MDRRHVPLWGVMPSAARTLTDMQVGLVYLSRLDVRQGASSGLTTLQSADKKSEGNSILGQVPGRVRSHRS